MEFRDLIQELVRLFKVKVYMELGTKAGYTFNTIAAMDEITDAIGIDIKRDYRIPKQFKVVFYEMTTDKAFKTIVKGMDGPPMEFVDLLFIDADHTFQQAQKDFLNFSQFVKEGTGLILLHDTHPINRRLTRPGYCSDAWKLARLIREALDLRERFEIVTLPGPYAGMSIVRKSKTILSWMTEKESP